MGHELTSGFELDGREYNVPTHGRRSGKHLSSKEAIRRARKLGLLGRGFKTAKEAEEYAKRRSRRQDLGDMFHAPHRSGGRIRRRHGLMGFRDAFNPGGKKPSDAYPSQH